MSDLTDAAAVSELGRRIALHRLDRDLTQADLAEQAGVARSTVQRIERGESVQLSSFVKLLRTLERLEALDALLDAEIRSPLAELERERGRPRRKRARSQRGDDAPGERGWSWGEE